jgi:hypothetical protein
MLIMHRDGSLHWDGCENCTSGRAGATIEISANVLAQQSDLIDRVFALAFDVLGLRALKIHVRATEECQAGL